MSNSTKPEYKLLIKTKEGGKRYTLGGAVFASPYGGFNLVLNPGITLRWDDELYFNLVPFDYVYQPQERDTPNGATRTPSAPTEVDEDYGDSEIPF